MGNAVFKAGVHVVGVVGLEVGKDGRGLEAAEEAHVQGRDGFGAQKRGEEGALHALLGEGREGRRGGRGVGRGKAQLKIGTILSLHDTNELTKDVSAPVPASALRCSSTAAWRNANWSSGQGASASSTASWRSGKHSATTSAVAPGSNRTSCGISLIAASCTAARSAADTPGSTRTSRK